MIITKDSKTPLCQQFDSLHDALLDSLWKKSNLDVYEAVYRLEPKTIERIASEVETLMILSNEDYCMEKKWLVGIDEVAVKKNASECHKAYKSELKNLFKRIMSKLDTNLRSELAKRENWKEISREKDTINLLKTLRKICYGYNKTPSLVQYNLDRKRFIDQFVICTQKKGQRIDDYIAEMQSYYNVLKVHGTAEIQSYYNGLKVHGKRGGTFGSEYLIQRTIQSKCGTFDEVEFDSLCADNKKRLEKDAGRIVLATAIVKGCKKSSWENHRIHKYAKTAGLYFTPDNGNPWTPLQSGLEMNEIAAGLQMCAAW